jgi:hypothetical protein
MLQMGERDGTDHRQGVHPADRHTVRFPQQRTGQALRHPDQDGGDIGEDDRVDRMDAEGRQQRQAFGGVMDRMELPQQRDGVAQIMIEPVRKFISEIEQHRQHRTRHERRQAERRNRAGCQTNQRRNLHARQHCPAEQQPIAEEAEREPPQIGAARGAGEHPARE